jgi:hypothetical protein
MLVHGNLVYAYPSPYFSVKVLEGANDGFMKIPSVGSTVDPTKLASLGTKEMKDQQKQTNPPLDPLRNARGNVR